MSPSTTLPGHLLGPTTANNPGEGTHIHNTQLYASIAGPVPSSTPATTKLSSALSPTLSITRPTGPLLPTVHTTILGTITRTTPRQAHLSIHALGPLGSHTLTEPFPALIRSQDIRATETDKVVVADSFRVGDVVRAVVISLGDERSYFCSTARNDLGVVMAWSVAGNAMVPVSWREFLDGETGGREGRKVAKPV